jgi:hypothetical protein
MCRGVAQPGSAPVLGTGGRVFESLRPDHFLLRFKMSNELFKTVNFTSAKVYKNIFSATQSGKHKGNYWILEPLFSKNFIKDNLMGWSGGRDIKQQIKLKFNSLNDLERYAEQNKISLEIIQPKEKKVIIKSYSDNFINNNRI